MDFNFDKIFKSKLLYNALHLLSDHRAFDLYKYDKRDTIVYVILNI